MGSCAWGDASSGRLARLHRLARPAVVNCGPRVDPESVVATNPVIVVEVLSPSTQSIDTTDKLADHFRVTSIRHYLIMRARRREIIRHFRLDDGIGSRVVNLGSIRLDPPGISLDFGAVYAGVS